MRLFGLEITRARDVVGARPAGMTEAEVVGCFSVGPNAPLWRGINVLIDQICRERVEDSCNPELSDSETKYALGGVAFGSELKNRALDYFRMAAEEQEDSDAEEREGH